MKSAENSLLDSPTWAAVILCGESEPWLNAYRTVNEEFDDEESLSLGTLISTHTAMKLTAFRTFSGQFSIPESEVEFVEALPCRWNGREIGSRSGVGGFKFRKRGSQGTGILIRVEVQEIGVNVCQITQSRVSLVGLDLD